MAAVGATLAEPEAKRRNWSPAFLIVWLAVIWAAVIAFPIPPLVWTFPFVCLLYLARGRFKPLALYVLLSPLTFFALEGAFDYARGRARLQYNGLPGPEFYNADPELRCCLMSHG